MKENILSTQHHIYFEDSRKLKELKNNSINLVVTSPPYPMIEMWDEVFCSMNPEISKALKNNDGKLAFELMNNELDKVWDECFRVLKDGGVLCINIGDATRTINKNFQLFSSHSRILNYCLKKDFHNLPNIIWRKTTNSPNKYMGSGMLPVGAYVTLEHEYILIFRKGYKREFNSIDDKKLRRKSAFFWEERNKWFSDVWFDLKGISQKLNDTGVRERSAAFPFELVYRLINMYSVIGDTILDPFLGTGTTILASIVTGRNSVGVELEKNFLSLITKTINESVSMSKKIYSERVYQHLNFIEERGKDKDVKSKNKNYKFGCVSQQETDIEFYIVKDLVFNMTNKISVSYETFSLTDEILSKSTIPIHKKKNSEKTSRKKNNYELF